MYPDSSLKEAVSHGTAQKPITGIHFCTGKGTPYPDHFFVERHWHHTVEIIYILKGEFHFEINLENYLLKTGDICFLNGEDLHQITGIGSDTAHDVLIFDPLILNFSYPDELEEQIIAPFLARKQILPHIIHPSDSAHTSICPVFQQIMELSVRKSSGWYAECKLLLLRLLCIMAEQHLLVTAENSITASDFIKIDRYKKLVSYMEEHYPEPVTLEQLGNVIACNPQYLCRFFKEITGTSPVRYLIERRIEHACKLLTETGKPILEISLDCGFENASYFIRKFRQLKGCTPKEYRNNHHIHTLL